MYNRTYSFRCSDKTIKNIEEIKKQMKESKYFNDFNITNGYIIRLAIKMLNQKFKYIIWTK